MGENVDEEKDYVQINLSIPVKMKEWLDEHRNINRSELFRQAVKQKMYVVEQKVSPLFFLASVMGIMFGVVLILISIAPTPLNVYIRAPLSLIGGIMAVLSALLYFKESRKLKKGVQINA